ncbi:MAG TPA: peptidylprolyl isomerase [Polyangiaceae bacterium]|nr:peptidylprolyl isomerase [Polyangiaceae bacterium]
MQKIVVRRGAGWQNGTRLAGLCVGLMGVALGACRSTPAEPESRQPAPAQPAPADNAPSIPENAPASPAATASPTAAADPAGSAAGAPGGGGAASGASAPAAELPVPPGHRKVSARPVAPVVPSPGDPLGGKFTLADATQGLPGTGKLVAEIRTSLGKLQCDLYEDRAPLTVANFIGLARGLRPFKNAKGEWTKTAGYDGTTFHRVIKGFMIQGGDPAGTGAGEPGYVIPDEIWEGAYHSERGLLCMANRGPNTNGMQFFIMDGSAPHLDNGYTIFGKCGPDAVLEKLASVEVQGDRAVKPPKIEKVVIRRDAAKKP